MTTRNRKFCIGEQLTFRSVLAESAYEWIFIGFLNGTAGNGLITTTAGGTSETIEEFMLFASGTVAMGTDMRMSSLQVTVFEGLVGERNVTCREAFTTTNTQSVSITVFGESFSNIIIISFLHLVQFIQHGAQ